MKRNPFLTFVVYCFRMYALPSEITALASSHQMPG